MTAGLPPALSGGANVSLLNAAAHTAGYGAAAGVLATMLAFPVALLAVRHARVAGRLVVPFWGTFAVDCRK
jgi:ABC-type Fe3+ transport system permease subunit